MEPIHILFKSPELVVCVKPTGVLSQSGKPNQPDMPSLLSAQLGCQILPVHRLDREVGGVMVYAKTPASAASLSRQIQQGSFEKEYLAVVRGIPASSAGMMTDLLFHDRNRNKTYVVSRRRKGVKDARLLYRVLDTVDGQTLVQVRLLTGRTHQIRVQFASRGLPLLGDGRYGGGSGTLQLWSARVGLSLPNRGHTAFAYLPDQLGPFISPVLPEPLNIEKKQEAQKNS